MAASFIDSKLTSKTEQTDHVRDVIDDVSLTNFQGRAFVPCDKIGALVTPPIVAKVLAGLEVSEKERMLLENFVFDGVGARRLFLILTMTKLLGHFGTLRRHNFNDDALPVRIDRLPGTKTTVGVSLKHPETNYDFFDEWDFNHRSLLTANQWQFLSPEFGDKDFHFKFNIECRLPYLGREESPTASGFFGEVFLTNIHKAHLAKKAQWSGDVSSGDSIRVAIKKVKGPEDSRMFDQEANNLYNIYNYNSNYLIKPIAAYRYADERCLMFPWADGGNLDNYWKKLQSLTPDRAGAEKIRWFITQFTGLCDALRELHTNKKNCIHGDLKPENILMFKREGSQTILQIADLGLAAFHIEPDTGLRVASGARSGTSRYKPPEMDQNTGDISRGRAYDIWSMGCILLELLVWFTSGYGALGMFKQRTFTYFWSKVAGDYIIHPEVQSYMELAERKLKTHSCFADILQLVRRNLLVNKDDRIKAEPLHNKIKEIQRKCEESPQDSSYCVPIPITYTPDTNRNDRNPQHPWVLIRPKLEVPGRRAGAPRTLPGPNSDNTATNGGPNPQIFVTESSNEPSSGSGGTLNRETQSKSLDNMWESIPDDSFASEFFKNVGWNQVKPAKHNESPGLCSRCRNIGSPAELFTGEYNLSEIQSTSSGCELCKLLLDRLQDVGVQPPGPITLRQIGSQVGIENGPDLLSLYSEPGSSLQQEAPLGLPWLLEPASPEHFTLLQQWLQLCDSTHSMCRREYSEDPPNMPTRLLDVGHPLHVVDSTCIATGRYVALSHCWGIISERFCTLQSNISQLKQSIDFEKLPLTFRDAITVTRGLGIQYIWIDSLCIIQDDSEDWYREAARMELVFSEAYCTLGASSSRSSVEGFLARGPRSRRRCVQLSVPLLKTTGDSSGSDSGGGGERTPLFVCPAIDDFHRDVELGPLNSRGWVLQERALSRRSIHYTSTQVYWECSAGVHCETLTRLRNAKAGFLGDANFPKFAMNYYRDGRQLLVQDLFERYSRLGLTQPTDRYVALLGLQRRMARAFSTHAAWGTFSAYFARGLLWSRCSNVAGSGDGYMEPIAWPPGHHVPSWSWISKLGAIEYMELEFETVEWARGEIKNPLARGGPAGDGQQREEGVLWGLARPLLSEMEELRLHITFDLRDDHDVGRLRCVVVGRDKMDTSLDDQRHYALIIHPKSDMDGSVYERVGVATLSAAHIGDGEAWLRIR